MEWMQIILSMCKWWNDGVSRLSWIIIIWCSVLLSLIFVIFRPFFPQISTFFFHFFYNLINFFIKVDRTNAFWGVYCIIFNFFLLKFGKNQIFFGKFDQKFNVFLRFFLGSMTFLVFFLLFFYDLAIFFYRMIMISAFRAYFAHFTWFEKKNVGFFIIFVIFLEFFDFFMNFYWILINIWLFSCNNFLFLQLLFYFLLPFSVV